MIKNLATMNKTALRDISGDRKTKFVNTTEKQATWQQELAGAIRTIDALYDRLGLKEKCSINTECHAGKSGQEGSLVAATAQFPVLVPESFLNRMVPGDPNDPLLLQVLPDSREMDIHSGFSQDPVGETDSVLSPGIIQKYQGRALMVTLGQCAVHCRYCFRRNYPYEQSPKSLEQWTPSLKKLEEDPKIEEIILSGGDPLVLNDRRLQQLVAVLDSIDQLKRIRIHTRLPIVLPARITQELLDLFLASRLQPVFVVHANHPNEIVDDCAEALRQIVRAGIPVLNQAVLLKNINDTTETQAKLCERLVNLGVIPYYLHQLDRVQGAAHFEVEVSAGKKIIEQLKQQLPGYAVPRFVREIPGEAGKTELQG